MLSAALFWVLVVLSAAMLLTLVLLLGGIIPLESPATRATTSAETSGVPAASPTAPARTPTAPPTPEVALVVLTATRGECWFQARLGSETGRVLEERLLAPGESARFEARRIWLMVGAAGNVELTVDGRPRALSPGTVSVVLTAAQTPNQSS
jgi:hypothetical protein